MKPVTLIIFAFALAIFAPLSAKAADRVTFGTDWRAQAEHGGFYQAIATGIYQRYGLDVELRQGGPMVNHAQLLAAGRLDYSMAPNSFIPLNFVAQNIPMVAVAAIFQKDPAVLIAHPNAGHDSLADLSRAKIMISPDTRVGFWRFLKSKFGYSDEQIAPYTFNLAPFLADTSAVQQGYLTSEPYQIERAGIKPNVFLLADAGYASYAAIIMTSRDRVEKSPDQVKRFVAASIAGWVSYLNDDPSPADNLIKADNPDMSDALLAYAREQMRRNGVVDGGDAAQFGVGVMTSGRWRDFFEVMAQDGLYDRGLDFTRAY
ncbi:MAG: ABC transporter substrate-binding protein, partial [Rhodobacteraceae bacterium]|nr:ABC transporter substrate-binding protein [Paracoccaceae bacterium]